MKKDIKVKVVLSEGYEERFTKACIKVVKKRIEQQEKVIPRAEMVPEKVLAAV